MDLASLFSVAGKVVVVTGGGRGIGRMIAEGFVRNDAKVYIASRNLSKCEEAAAELNALGRGACIAVQATLDTEEGCKAFAADMATRESRLDVLVNNSGCGIAGDIDNQPGEAWDAVLGLNVKAPFFLTRDLLPLLDEAATSPEGSSVINVGSVGGIQTTALNSYTYPTSKAAIHHLTRVMAGKLARRPNGGKIRVNAIAPGLVPTDMTQQIADRFGGFDTLAKMFPLARTGTAEDMAGAALYLASRAGSWITGVIMPVDGGQLLGLA